MHALPFLIALLCALALAPMLLAALLCSRLIVRGLR